MSFIINNNFYLRNIRLSNVNFIDSVAAFYSPGGAFSCPASPLNKGHDYGSVSIRIVTVESARRGGMGCWDARKTE